MQGDELRLKYKGTARHVWEGIGHVTKVANSMYYKDRGLQLYVHVFKCTSSCTCIFQLTICIIMIGVYSYMYMYMYISTNSMYYNDRGLLLYVHVHVYFN